MPDWCAVWISAGPAADWNVISISSRYVKARNFTGINSLVLVNEHSIDSIATIESRVDL